MGAGQAVPCHWRSVGTVPDVDTKTSGMTRGLDRAFRRELMTPLSTPGVFADARARHDVSRFALTFLCQAVPLGSCGAAGKR